MTASALTGVTVLVTRPEALAGPLAQKVEEADGTALRFPAVDIVQADDIAASGIRLADAGRFDLVIFVSVNAVRFGLGLVPADDDGRPLLAAIGPATRQALEKARRCDICSDSGYTSEALLQEPHFQDVKGKRILIVRGKGGRELLFETLDRRGAVVHLAEVYERRAPKELTPPVRRALADAGIDVVTATSVEILCNIHTLVTGDEAAMLLDVQLVTASPRVVQKAAELGFTHPALLATAPDDQALFEAIVAWQANRVAQGQTMKDETNTDGNSDAGSEAGSEVSSDLQAVTAVPSQPEPAAPNEPPAPEPEASPKPPRSGVALAAIAFLVALLAGAIGGYAWWQQRSLSAELVARNQAALDSAAAQVSALETQLSATRNRLGEVDRLDTAQRRLSDDLGDSNNAIDRLSARIQGVEGAMDSLRGVSATARQAWIRAQAEYFLVTANDSLQLAGNSTVALAALENADARLQELGDPGLSSTRAALAEEIAALRALPKPDIEGIVHELGGLAARIDQLPLANEILDPSRADAPREAQGDSAWQRARNVVASAVRDTVTVRRATAQDTPMLAPSETFFLRRNVELQLEVARLAALRGEAATFGESLRSARRWLSNWFDNSDSAVTSAIEALTRLESQEITPSLPDISGSLRLMRTAPAVAGDNG